MNNNTYRRSLVGPVILIGFGVILLLNNLGLLSWTIWDTLFRLWPVILIAIGLDILIGRRSLWGSLLSAALVLAIFGGAIWLFASRPAGGEAVTTEQISQPLGGDVSLDGTVEVCQRVRVVVPIVTALGAPVGQIAEH